VPRSDDELDLGDHSQSVSPTRRRCCRCEGRTWPLARGHRGSKTTSHGRRWQRSSASYRDYWKSRYGTCPLSLPASNRLRTNEAKTISLFSGVAYGQNHSLLAFWMVPRMVPKYRSSDSARAKTSNLTCTH